MLYDRDIECLERSQRSAICTISPDFSCAKLLLTLGLPTLSDLVNTSQVHVAC